jgi:hypothetical protein
MDEQRADPRVTTAADTIEELHHYLADPPSLERLYGILRSYVRKDDVVPPESVDDEAFELLQNVVVKALEIADKYSGVGIRPWLLSIAKNLMKRRVRRVISNGLSLWVICTCKLILRSVKRNFLTCLLPRR